MDFIDYLKYLFDDIFGDFFKELRKTQEEEKDGQYKKEMLEISRLIAKIEQHSNTVDFSKERAFIANEISR